MLKRSDQSSSTDESNSDHTSFGSTSTTTAMNSPFKTDSPLSGVSLKQQKVPDFCLRVVVLGDGSSDKRKLIYNFLCGGMNKSHIAQEAMFEEISGYVFVGCMFVCDVFPKAIFQRDKL